MNVKRCPAALSDTTLKAIGYRKPMSRFGQWCSPKAADDANELSMRTGSDALLRAIWRSHQRVMLVAKASGRCVVIPNERRA